MKPRIVQAILVLLSLFSVPAISSSETAGPSAAVTGPGTIQQQDALSFLPGKTWQLVEIVSMNDRVHVPDNRSLYTVRFKTDGVAQIRTDCNRGTGSWTSTAPGKLQFGRIAATQAQCPAGSLHDRYMAQLPWVRSYVVKDGHLFLATMADGSIIEFEPVQLPLAATVLGKEVRTSDAAEMQEIVLSRLFDRYAVEHGIEVTDEEIDTYVGNMQRGMSTMGLTAEDELTAQPSPAGEMFAAADDGGPLNWQVRGIAGGLNLRATPSTSAEIIATYPAGTILDNLGCQQTENRIWCDVQPFGGGPRGFVAAEFLTAAVSPDGSVIAGPDDSALRSGRGDFDATGHIPCAQHKGQPMTTCEFGVSRKGGGYATVVITKPDGVTRAIFFRLGIAVGADTSQADGYSEFRANMEQDLHLIRVGDERYEIPEAVIFSG